MPYGASLQECISSQIKIELCDFLEKRLIRECKRFILFLSLLATAHYAYFYP